MQRTHFYIIVFFNPVNVNAFAICGGDEIMISRVTVWVINEWPNAFVCLSSAFFFYECIFDYVCAYRITVGEFLRCDVPRIEWKWLR